jgi:hypothetical protein
MNNNCAELNLNNLDANTNEGKYLLAAVAILTTSEFEFNGTKINGKGLEPDGVFKILETCVKAMYRTGGE